MPTDTDKVLTVRDVNEHIHWLDGRTVEVGGWLDVCDVYDCHMRSSKAEAAAAFETRDFEKVHEISLSIGSRGPGGSDTGFDEKAKPLQFSNVVVTAQINDDCFRGTCTDRANILEPIDIRPASTTQKSN